MRTHVILILLIVSCMSFASTEGSYQQRVNPKFKVGVVEINRDDLIRNADIEVSHYLESTGWRRKKKIAFWEAYRNIMTAIQKGHISERDVSKMWIDKTGVITNSSGKGFDANGAVCNFLGMIVDRLVELGYYQTMSSSAQQNNSSANNNGNLNDITRILKKNK